MSLIKRPVKLMRVERDIYVEKDFFYDFSRG